jgi:DNA polymerase elongation subunit (family B)
LIHKKLNTLTPFLKLSQIANTEMLKCYGSVHLVENLMIYELLKYNKIFVFDKNKKIIENDEKFKGAFVNDPIKGFHSNLAVFDYASLYPTTIRQWNISPDVYLGKNIETDLDESEYIKTCSGAMFKRNEDGVLKTILTDLYTQRDLSKVNKGDIEKEIDILNKKIKSL